jgi:hypothetical protein
MEQVQFSRTALQFLPVASAPPGLWQAIESASGSELRGLRRTTPWLLWRWATAAVLLALAGSGLWLWVRPRGGPWVVEALDGSLLAGSRRLSGRQAIATGEWIATDAQSHARIAIGSIGEVRVEPNTSVQLVSTDPQGHRLALRSGAIFASISAPPRLFFVDTPAGTAIDLGCEYRLQCDRAGTGMLQVTSGWVALQWHGRESLVPAGASCRLYAGRGPGTPWFDDATRTVVEALESFDSGSGEALNVLLPEARVRDTLTLWHLLARARAQDRVRIYERMADLAPPPSTVTREQVVALDPEGLQRWREELAWVW